MDNHMPYCERCGSKENASMLREPMLFGTISAVLCISCKREFDAFAVKDDSWKEVIKILHLIGIYSTKDMFNEAAIKALWDKKNEYDRELVQEAKDWLYNVPKEIDIEGQKILLQ
ncbi:hypothetical protein LCGC14_2041580 [marine sediment metagenome]|uniref:Uncharacterized protein n=1 Tax=marine sediment metagenome TaxID=412755 RepID=A0A0F9H593_9ZZZZ